MKQLWVFAMMGILLLTACSSGASSQTETGAGSDSAYTNISVSELQTMLENKDFTFVNVHIPFEGDIANTDVSIPYNEIEQNLDLLPADKDARIVLYCRSGRMSEIAAKKLAGLGYTNIQNLEGGMIAWEAAGLPLIGK